MSQFVTLKVFSCRFGHRTLAVNASEVESVLESHRDVPGHEGTVPVAILRMTSGERHVVSDFGRHVTGMIETAAAQQSSEATSGL